MHTTEPRPSLVRLPPTSPAPRLHSVTARPRTAAEITCAGRTWTWRFTTAELTDAEMLALYFARDSFDIQWPATWGQPRWQVTARALVGAVGAGGHAWTTVPETIEADDAVLRDMYRMRASLATEWPKTWIAPDGTKPAEAAMPEPPTTFAQRAQAALAGGRCRVVVTARTLPCASTVPCAGRVFRVGEAMPFDASAQDLRDIYARRDVLSVEAWPPGFIFPDGVTVREDGTLPSQAP